MSYRVLTGIDYPPDKRAEVGDVVDDIPAKSAKWLIEQGHIEEVGKGKGSAKPAAPDPEPAPEPEPEPEPEDGD